MQRIFYSWSIRGGVAGLAVSIVFIRLEKISTPVGSDLRLTDARIRLFGQDHDCQHGPMSSTRTDRTARTRGRFTRQGH